MAAKIWAATERALARVASGETVSAAAKAECIAPSAIYRALRKPDEANYAHGVGAIFGAICARHGHKITATAMANISMHPDLMRTYLRHLDLAEYDIPARPEGWRPGAKARSMFWLGYYNALNSE